MGDFLFFGTKKYFFGVKIERKNIEKCRIILFGLKKIFLYFCTVQLIIRSVAAPQMTGNLSTQHPERHGIKL